MQRPVKMGCIDLLEGVQSAQRQMSTKIPTVLCANLSASVSIADCPSVGQYKCTIICQHLKNTAL